MIGCHKACLIMCSISLIAAVSASFCSAQTDSVASNEVAALIRTISPKKKRSAQTAEGHLVSKERSRIGRSRAINRLAEMRGYAVPAVPMLRSLLIDEYETQSNKIAILKALAQIESPPDIELLAREGRKLKVNVVELMRPIYLDPKASDSTKERALDAAAEHHLSANGRKAILEEFLRRERNRLVSDYLLEVDRQIVSGIQNDLSHAEIETLAYSLGKYSHRLSDNDALMATSLLWRHQAKFANCNPEFFQSLVSCYCNSSVPDQRTKILECIESFLVTYPKPEKLLLAPSKYPVEDGLYIAKLLTRVNPNGVQVEEEIAEEAVEPPQPPYQIQLIANHVDGCLSISPSELLVSVWRRPSDRMNMFSAHSGTAYLGENIHVYSVSDGQLVYKLFGPLSKPRFSLDSQYLTYGTIYSAVVWNLEKNAKHFELREKGIADVRLVDGKQLVQILRLVPESAKGSAPACRMAIWDMSTKTNVTPAIFAEVDVVAMSQDWQMVSGYHHHELKVWNALNGEEFKTVNEVALQTIQNKIMSMFPEYSGEVLTKVAFTNDPNVLRFSPAWEAAAIHNLRFVDYDLKADEIRDYAAGGKIIAAYYTKFEPDPFYEQFRRYGMWGVNPPEIEFGLICAIDEHTWVFHDVATNKQVAKLDWSKFDESVRPFKDELLESDHRDLKTIQMADVQLHITCSLGYVQIDLDQATVVRRGLDKLAYHNFNEKSLEQLNVVYNSEEFIVKDLSTGKEIERLEAGKLSSFHLLGNSQGMTLYSDYLNEGGGTRVFRIRNNQHATVSN